MALKYEELSSSVRSHMKAEYDRDQDLECWHRSDHLTAVGLKQWPELLEEAILNHDDDWLEGEIAGRGLLKPYQDRRRKDGTPYKMPGNAAQLLAEGEFNRLYCRGLCLEVLEVDQQASVPYRGRDSESRRPESEQIDGAPISARELLNDLRNSNGQSPSLLPQVGSGMTVRRLRRGVSP